MAKRMSNKKAKQMICDVIKAKYGYREVKFSYEGYCQCIGKRSGKSEYLYLQYTTQPVKGNGFTFPSCKGIWEYKSLKFLGKV